MRPRVRHPARIVPIAFLLAVLAGTALLSLPVATADGERPPLLTAAFTSVSAVCVTGLTVTDTSTYWSAFGHVVILALIQVGGLGLMTLATLLWLLVGARLKLSSSMVAQAETHSRDIGDVRAVVRRVAATVLVFESVIAIVLTLRFRLGYGDGWGEAAWYGTFHSISAFNNAGFSLFGDNLVGFVSDGWVVFPICVAVIAGGIGFPVLSELSRRGRTPRRWSVHARLTVSGTAALLAIGTAAFLALEWTNPGTLGPLSPWGKLVAGAAGGVMPRTAGFNTVDYGQITPETMTIQYALMFIGGGSAGTAGGIKITTFLLLGYAVWSEVRGERDTNVGRRRISDSTIRQALAVALLGIAVVAAGTMFILLRTAYPLDVILFEVISAFATVGLSTGITPHLPPSADLTLMALMFVGRVGSVTVGTALALRSGRGHNRYRLPEERPLVG